MLSFFIPMFLDSPDTIIFILFTSLILCFLIPAKLLQKWNFFPFPKKKISSFFATFTIGWILIRCCLWIFLYAQASLESPYLRFHVAGPITASQNAAAWSFPRLQELIEETLIHKERSLRTETNYTRTQIELIVNGLNEAEAFRQSLFQTYPSGKTRAQITALALLEFQNAANPHLQDRQTLDDFYFDEQELIDFITGDAGRIYDAFAFDPFDGNWHGKWDQNQVDHQWEPSQIFEPFMNTNSENPFGIRALQYAWIGDGFGWNAVIAPNCQNTGDVILGTVYHVRNQNPAEIYLHRPHVGIALDEGQLIWLTEKEVFLEQAYTHEDPQKDYYAITGFTYEIKGGKLINIGEGFQAVYTRDPNNRSDWYRFPLALSIDL